MRLWLRVFLGMAIVSGSSVAMTVPSPAPRDTVVLLHGLGRSGWSLKRVEWALRDAGYHVVNFDYPSRDLPIERIAGEKLAPLLRTLPLKPGAKVHFVTHSMGGIVLRCYLRDHPLPQLGRIVMLAPPNAGSEVTDHLLHTWLYRTVNGPAGQQLGTDGLPRTLGPAPGETGVIAGSYSLNPLFSSWMKGPNDGKVSMARTQLEGLTDFLTVPYSHTWLMWRKPVIRQILVSFAPAGSTMPGKRPSNLLGYATAARSDIHRKQVTQ